MIVSKKASFSKSASLDARECWGVMSMMSLDRPSRLFKRGTANPLLAVLTLRLDVSASSGASRNKRSNGQESMLVSRFRMRELSCAIQIPSEHT